MPNYSFPIKLLSHLIFEFIILGIILVQRSLAIPVDNSVLGDPEVECGSTYVTINLNTENEFNGHVFVKVDRAYRIQCFYMEAPKSVAQGIEVSILTTAGLNTENVPMPVCRYQVLAGGPSGPVITYALIGDQVYHKWTCDTETVNTFCMVVHSCYVDDTAGDRVELIGPDGCAIDRYLLNNLEYPTDLMAGQEAHVFKYADRPTLYFQCQITITIKEPFGTCARPQCRSPPRGKRAAGLDFDEHFGTLDVASQTVTALDLEESLDIKNGDLTKKMVSQTEIKSRRSGFCVSQGIFGLTIGMASVFLIAALIATSFLLIKRETNTISLEVQ